MMPSSVPVTDCMLACLREVGLHRYHAEFLRQGIENCEQLSLVQVHRYSALGLTRPDDRRRLYNLIAVMNKALVAVVGGVADAAAVNPSLTEPSPPTAACSERARRKAPPPRRASRRHAYLNPATMTSPEAALFQCRRKLVFEPDSDEEEEADDEAAAEAEDERDDEEGEGHVDEEEELWEELRLDPLVNKTDFQEVPLKEKKTVPTSIYSRIKDTKPVGNVATTKPPGEPVKFHKISVIIRKRPLLGNEIPGVHYNTVEVDQSANTISIREQKTAVNLTRYRQDHVFKFDRVYDQQCTNKQIYNESVRPLIDTVFKVGGYVTCFAFGASGAGKSYTLMGERNVQGIYHLAAQDLIEEMEARKCSVWISFYEIYCSQLYDLLNKRKKLQVRENDLKKVNIIGLMESQITDADSLRYIVNYGNQVRKKGKTSANMNSSRSHAVLQFEIRDHEEKRLGRLSFIDLAGSERASDVISASKQSKVEGAEINQSLLALKECIRSIDQESSHTPFRQSKLTHILRDCFQGYSRTVMIANVSPSNKATENTINTLRYAHRVKELKPSRPKPNTPLKKKNGLFHPSKIQLSSTPLIRNAGDSSQHKQFVINLSHDSPVRGHQLRKPPTKRCDTTDSAATDTRKTNGTKKVKVIVGAPQTKTYSDRVTPSPLRPPPSDRVTFPPAATIDVHPTTTTSSNRRRQVSTARVESAVRSRTTARPATTTTTTTTTTNNEDDTYASLDEFSDAELVAPPPLDERILESPTDRTGSSATATTTSPPPVQSRVYYHGAVATDHLATVTRHAPAPTTTSQHRRHRTEDTPALAPVGSQSHLTKTHDDIMNHLDTVINRARAAMGGQLAATDRRSRNASTCSRTSAVKNRAASERSGSFNQTGDLSTSGVSTSDESKVVRDQLTAQQQQRRRSEPKESATTAASRSRSSNAAEESLLRAGSRQNSFSATTSGGATGAGAVSTEYRPPTSASTTRRVQTTGQERAPASSRDDSSVVDAGASGDGGRPRAASFDRFNAFGINSDASMVQNQSMNENRSMLNRVKFINSHEQELVKCTQECKVEMLLLTSVKQGNLSFEEYLAETEDALTKKYDGLQAMLNTLRSYKQHHHTY